jgi:hypothetical protein
MPITTTDEQRRTAWIAFAKTSEYAALQPTSDNSRMLDREVRNGDAQYSCSALLQATRTLAALLDWKVATPAPVSAVPQPEPEPDESTLPGFPVKGGIESGYSYSCRVQNWREARAQAAFRERENRRMAAEPPAASTIRNTQNQIRQRQLENANWAAKKANQT